MSFRANPVQSVLRPGRRDATQAAIMPPLRAAAILSSVQLAALLDGCERRAPARARRPELAG